MIVDTSALVAVAYREPGYEPIRDALLSESGRISAPVLVEFHRVTSLDGNRPNPEAVLVIESFTSAQIEIVPFGIAAAMVAVDANPVHGSGNGRGGRLNMLDLMVYGMAKVDGLPILFTGKDFPLTDAQLHPASRLW